MPTAEQIRTWNDLVDRAFDLDRANPYLGQTVDEEAVTKSLTLKYSPDEPRDDKGMWTSGGGFAPSTPYQMSKDYSEARVEEPKRVEEEGYAAAIVEASSGKLNETQVLGFQHAWIGSSTSPDSLAMQQALGDKFGIDLSAAAPRIAEAQQTWDRVHALAPDSGPAQRALNDTVREQMAQGEIPPEKWSERVDQARAFVDAQYKVTQDFLASKGITQVNVARGVFFQKGDPIPEGYKGLPRAWTDGLDLKQPPISSWSGTYEVAERFAEQRNVDGALGTWPGQGYVLATTVPSERIFGMYASGIGTGLEREYAVIDTGLNVSAKSVASAYSKDDLGQNPYDHQAMLAAHKGATKAALEDPDIYEYNANWIRQLEVKSSRKTFNPDQPRDDHGRWTSGGGSADRWTFGKGWTGPTQAVEDKLRTAEIKNFHPNAKRGITASWTAEAHAKDGTVIPVLVKQARFEPYYNPAVNEVGTYEINKAMGFPVPQPEIVQREMMLPTGGPLPEITTVSTFVDGVKPLQVAYVQNADMIQPPYRDQMIAMGVLDAVVQNRDRHPGNVLVSPDGLIAIDHNLTRPTGAHGQFGPPDMGIGPATRFGGTPIPQHILDGLQRFVDSSAPEAAMRSYGYTKSDQTSFYGAKETAKWFLANPTLPGFTKQNRPGE